jgi:hypothetical protein
LYLCVVGVAMGLTIRSIVKHLRDPYGDGASGAAVLPTRAALRVCATELEALHREQGERAWRLGDDIGEGNAVARWLVWSREWEQRVADLGERCGLDVSTAAGGPAQTAGARQALGRARDAVLAVHRAYAAQVNRFAEQEADLARAAAAALREARRAIARPER